MYDEQKIEMELNPSARAAQDTRTKQPSNGSSSVSKMSSHVIMSSSKKAKHYLGSMKSNFEAKTGLSFSNSNSSQQSNKNHPSNNQLGDAPGQYCDEEQEQDLAERIFILMAYIYLALTFPLTIWGCFVVVYDYQRIVFFRFGRLRGGGEARGGGLYFALPFVDNYTVADMRTESFNVQAQEILSRDSVTVLVDAVVYYKVSNATTAVTSVRNHGESTRLLAATTLRTVLGTKSLAEILCDRESIRHTIETTLEEVTESWGVRVERIEIKDVRLPTSMQRAMAAEAESTREAKAKVIAAEGERQASHAMRLAADEMSMSPQALQLRYLQTLHAIAAERNSTIVFPLPMEIFGAFQALKVMSGVQQQQQTDLEAGTNNANKLHGDAIIEMMENPPTPGSSRDSS